MPAASLQNPITFRPAEARQDLVKKEDGLQVRGLDSCVRHCAATSEAQNGTPEKLRQQKNQTKAEESTKALETGPKGRDPVGFRARGRQSMASGSAASAASGIEPDGDS